jgi:O-antigen/teichoic acid export membrane protein
LFLSALFSAILLLRGDGLRGLVYGYILSSTLTVGSYLVIVRQLLPELAMNPLQFDRQEAAKMFGFSFRLYVTQAAVVVHNQIEKLFLALLVGVAAVGWYEIASDLAIKMRGAIGFLLTPVLPAASELSALGDSRRIRDLYFRTHKYLALIATPVIAYVAAISGRFVELWIGPDMKVVVIPLCVLLGVSLINLATGPGFLIYAGAGKLKPGVDAAVLGVVVNLVLSFGLIYRYGFAGAVLGTAVSLIISATYFTIVFHRQTGYSFFQLLSESYAKPLACSILSLASVLIAYPTRDLSWPGLVGVAIAFGAVYSALILLSQFFDAYDWNKIEGFVPMARHVRRLVRFA